MTFTRRAWIGALGAGAAGAVGAAAARGWAGRLRTLVDPPRVTVIGSGAAGIMAARALLDAGVPVELLEAGRWRSDVARSPEDDAPYESDSSFAWHRSYQPGGKLNEWTAHAPRFAAGDFAAWPLGYDELAPFYEVAERILGVTGRAERLASCPDGEFVAPLTMHEVERTMRARLASRSITVTPGRYAVYADAARLSHDGRAPVRRNVFSDARLERFHGAGYLRHLLDTSPRLSLVADAAVRSIEVDGEHRAVSVTCWRSRTGRLERRPVSHVVLAAGCLESTMILQSSGLGNASDTLGRYLTDHLLTRVTAAVPRSTSRPHTEGGSLASYGPGAYIPRFDASPYAFQTTLRHQAGGDDVLTLTAFAEMRARAENRVTLLGHDPRTLAPRAHITCARDAGDDALMERTIVMGQELLAQSGLRPGPTAPARYAQGTAVHYAGTCRMGDDPRHSVVDRFSRSHEVPNLQVVDASVFPSASEKNPTLTIMALAYRAGRHLAESLRRG